ncbi:MAG: hypothetical protein AB1Z98_33335 [Nannocystaceae bacterium]
MPSPGAGAGGGVSNVVPPPELPLVESVAPPDEVSVASADAESSGKDVTPTSAPP